MDLEFWRAAVKKDLWRELAKEGFVFDCADEVSIYDKWLRDVYWITNDYIVAKKREGPYVIDYGIMNSLNRKLSTNLINLVYEYINEVSIHGLGRFSRQDKSVQKKRNNCANELFEFRIALDGLSLVINTPGWPFTYLEYTVENLAKVIHLIRLKSNGDFIDYIQTKYSVGLNSIFIFLEKYDEICKSME